MQINCDKFNEKDKNCLKCIKKAQKILTEAILIECKSFYQTFLDIDAKITPINLMKEVDEKAIEDNSLYFYSYVVNGCFSAELALKYIFRLRNVSFKRKHDLEYLFGIFKTNGKKCLKEDYKKLCIKFSEIGFDQNTIEFELQTHGNNYDDFRYFWSEGKPIGLNNILISFIKTVCDYAIELSHNNSIIDLEEENNEI